MLLGLVCATAAHAQQSQSTAIATAPKSGAVPNVIRFSGSFHPTNGMPAQPVAAQPVESLTLSIYRDQTGGAPLWQETQNVAMDGDGKYSVLIGATQNDGVPLDLLSAGEPRWLGVQFNRPGESEQPRVLMASVPYALKSVDAETLGGKPASAYLLAPSGTLASNAVSTTASGTTTAPATSTTVMTNTTAVKPRTISGSAGFIPYFTDASNDLGNSVIQQSNSGGNSYIGIGTVPGAGANTTPSLDLRTYPFSQIGMAQTVDYLGFFSSDIYGPAIYWNPGKDLRLGKAGAQLYGAFGFVEQMRIQSATGNVGIGTMTPGSTLDVNGNINFAGVVRYQGAPVLQVPGGGNIALGTGALVFNVVTSTSGIFNTAMGVNALRDNMSGNQNTAVGQAALTSNTTGNQNTAIGTIALQNNWTGTANTAAGNGALSENSTGSYNTAAGGGALSSNTTGGSNTASGYVALASNTTGSNNAAFGYGALASNCSGIPTCSANANTAIGYNALTNNTTASNNTAVGYQALQGGTPASANTGSLNTASGLSALQNNTTGNSNTASGADALYSNTIGNFNTAFGSVALASNTTGVNNTAIGEGALYFNTSGNYNTAVGLGALEYGSGSNNIAIGYNAGGSVDFGGGSNNIHIGSLGSDNDSSVIRIGTAVPGSLCASCGPQTSFFAAGIRGITTGNNDAIPVMIDSAGQLGTVSSSRRYKEDIEDMGEASRDLMRLRPVTFRYKKPLADGSKPIQYGLIAEEVDEVYPDLVAHSADGQIETVKYQVLDSMLLNEVQRQQAEIGAQKEQLRRLEQQVSEQRRQNQSLQERLEKLDGVLISTPRVSGVGVR